MSTLKELFSDIECTIIGDDAIEVRSIQYRSDQVQPGDLFFCIVGLQVDGHSFAGDAIKRGAAVIVAERKLYLAETDDVTLVIVNDSRKAMASIAARFYENPSESFQLVGVTGTNGKTTTTFLIEQIAKNSGFETGRIGTIGVEIASQKETTSRTTPESCDLQAIFARMRQAHCDVVAMEVSSHALDLERCWDTNFAVTAFTNLTRDHLDYHQTFEAYFEAKARLFSSDYPAKRVICIDDKWGRELYRRCREEGQEIITFGQTDTANIHPKEVQLRSDGTQLVLSAFGKDLSLKYPLVGSFNIQNVMCAVSNAYALGISQEDIVSALAHIKQVPGRLERVDAHLSQDGAPKKAPAIFVDYAHTPDALEKVIEAVQTFTQGKTFVVFGCGGNRDTSKRSIMGRVALKADYVFVTSDNPRSEDPQAIIDDILAGMGDSTDRYEVQADRAAAIEKAILTAGSDDTVLIAGKGHEDYQLIGNQTRHFDDCEVALEVLKKHFA